MSKELRFNDKTIVSTPDPVYSSSMIAGQSQKKLNLNSLNDLPERADSVESLGILSITESEFRTSDAGRLREKEKEQALNSLKEFNLKSVNLTSIPSRFLKRSDVTENTQFNHSDSTISETDLIPGNCSTPRGSLLQTELVMKERPSTSGKIQSFLNSMRLPSFNLEDTYKEFQKTTNLDLEEDSFQSGSLVMAKLEEDEKLWKKENDIPATLNDFSVESFTDPKLSMGSFFIKKSDDLPKIFARSPEKTLCPTPLIETSSATTNFHGEDKDSIAISDIQKILCDQPTHHALDMFLNTENSIKANTGKHDKLRSDSFLNEELKENISPEVVKSNFSSHSSSSLSSLPNGRLPVATTKSEIIWGCIKLGRTHSQDFVIRNRSSSRLGILCSISNPSFRLHKDGLEGNYTNIIKLVLHPYESRSLTVTFSPTTMGAAVDNLTFTSLDLSHLHTVKQFIRLYGYGGFGNITFHNMIKDTSGRFLLSLGNIDREHKLRRSFKIENTGSLTSFVYFEFLLNNLYSISNLEVSPQTSILLPRESTEVVVSYHLQKKDFYYLKSTVKGYVIDVGKLQVHYGTEANRGRVRKVCQKAKEKNMQIHPCVLKLIAQLPGEVIPTDLKCFKESPGSMDVVLKLLHKEDIIVTVEQDIDLTLNEQFQDETAMFQSLYENTAMDPLQPCKDICQVEPTRIILTPPDKVRDKIFITNNHLKRIYFEINSAPDGLYLKPREGTITPNEMVIIDLMYVQQCHDKTVFKVRILVDNESFDVDVKIMYVKCK